MNNQDPDYFEAMEDMYKFEQNIQELRGPKGVPLSESIKDINPPVGLCGMLVLNDSELKDYFEFLKLEEDVNFDMEFPEKFKDYFSDYITFYHYNNKLYLINKEEIIYTCKYLNKEDDEKTFTILLQYVVDGQKIPLENYIDIFHPIFKRFKLPKGSSMYQSGKDFYLKQVIEKYAEEIKKKEDNEKESN